MRKITKCILWLLPIILTVPLITTIYCLNTKKINSKLDFNGNEYLDVYKQLYEKNPNLSFEELNSLVSNVSNSFGMKYWHDWIFSLSYKDWERDKQGNAINLYCNSERQALFMYTQMYGHFWNYYLHNNLIPPDGVLQKKDLIKLVKTNHDLEYRGNDFQYISNALQRAKTPCNLVVYHGVEFMENEFYDQLKDYITGNDEEGYDYSNCVGKTITSYGYLSTSLSIKVVSEYTWGNDWMHGGIHLPLKEPFIFRIKIKKDTTGCGYMSGYPIMNSPYDSCDEASQILLDKNKSFKILGYYKLDDGNNLFELEMI